MRTAILKYVVCCIAHVVCVVVRFNVWSRADRRCQSSNPWRLILIVELARKLPLVRFSSGDPPSDLLDGAEHGQ